MKRIIFISSFLFILTSSLYSQKIEFSDFDLEENLPNWIMIEINDLKINKKLKVDRHLNPYYLESDFNGDNHLDIALFVINLDNNKKGILIIHGETLETKLIGAGDTFGNGGDDFSWLKVWKIYRAKVAFETTFTQDFDIAGSKEIQLKNIAISIAPSEGTYNLIVWNGNEYKWIHTGD